jgi:hypothetical protein
MVTECTSLVKPLFEAIFNGDETSRQDITKRISEAEKQADLFKMEIRRIMPKAVFLPVHREDLLRYLKIQDDLADTVEDIAMMASMKKLTSPPRLREEIIAYLEIVLKVCSFADEATNHLKPLVEAGFKGEDFVEVLELAEKAEVLEHQADEKGLQVARTLMALEDEMKPSDLIIWFRILKYVGKLADYSDKTGEWLRNMLAK